MVKNNHDQMSLGKIVFGLSNKTLNPDSAAFIRENFDVRDSQYFDELFDKRETCIRQYSSI